MALCDCNGRRIPNQWKVSISGVGGGGCCAGFDGDYVVSREGGTSCTLFILEFTAICTVTRVSVGVTDNGDGTYRLGVSFAELASPPDLWVTIAGYQLNGIRDLCAGPFTLDQIPFPIYCSWPSTCTLTAIVPNIANLTSLTCLSPPLNPRIFPFGGLPDPGQNCPAFPVPTPRNPPGDFGPSPGDSGDGNGGHAASACCWGEEASIFPLGRVCGSSAILNPGEPVLEFEDKFGPQACCPENAPGGGAEGCLDCGGSSGGDGTGPRFLRGSATVVEPSSAPTTNIWDYENQLIGVELFTGVRVTMAYNAYFRRVRKES